MKTNLETRLIVDLDWEERYLNELEQMAPTGKQAQWVEHFAPYQVELQKKAVRKAFFELAEYYLNLKEV